MDNISIHALCEEGDGAGLLLSTCKQLFLSTPSARRATPVRRGAWSRRGYFYPRPLRGGRPRYLVPPRASFSNFYPRPPRGGRLRPPAPCCPGRYFYPRPPRGGRHPGGLGDHQKVGISIPALREEGDPAVPATRSASSYFYPRPPRGGRLSWPSKEAVPRRHISIPALREEGDTVYMRGCKVDSEFLSPPSARRATARRLRRREAISYFYPRPPRGGRLIQWPTATSSASISIPALREEGDTRMAP